jgi:hypothetical protein
VVGRTDSGVAIIAILKTDLVGKLAAIGLVTATVAVMMAEGQEKVKGQTQKGEPSHHPLPFERAHVFPSPARIAEA